MYTRENYALAKAEIATELKQILIGNGYPSDMALDISRI